FKKISLSQILLYINDLGLIGTYSSKKISKILFSLYIKYILIIIPLYTYNIYIGNLLFVIAFSVAGLPFALVGYTPLSLGAGFLYSVKLGSVTVGLGSFIGSTFGFI